MWIVHNCLCLARVGPRHMFRQADSEPRQKIEAIINKDGQVSRLASISGVHKIEHLTIIDKFYLNPYFYGKSFDLVITI